MSILITILTGFLKTLMPRKPLAELYAAIGYNKHGKTEFYLGRLPWRPVPSRGLAPEVSS